MPAEQEFARRIADYEVSRRIPPMEVESNARKLARAYLELEAELQAAQGLLLECHGWMNGVEPKPAQPFLDAVLAAAQRTEEASDGR